ncbi:MAG TPA: glycosyltransferase [Anaerolineaceae bacterium]|jgi:glycosyltransferase involved in cell wall biosynthesis|nr:glycosyltransferase [Anaerolineaceae bacterium]
MAALTHPRILQVIANLEIGGAQEVVRTLSAYFKERGCPTTVCSFRDGPLRAEIERLEIPVEIIPGRQHSLLSPYESVRELMRIRRSLLHLVEKYQIDVIQTHLLRSLDFLVASLKISHPRLLVFWTVHNYQFQLRAEQLTAYRWMVRPKNSIHRLLYRWTSTRIEGFIAVADQVHQAIQQGIGPADGRVTTISNGVDVPRYRQMSNRRATRSSLGLRESDYVIILVGTLKEQKGHCYLIEAAAPLIAENPSIHILFAGDGELGEPLRRQVAQAGLEKNIHFLGSRNDIPDLLAASDTFVLPSLWEGLPMALIEAMASGLPVIATQVSGSEQVVETEQTGILVPPGDALELRRALVRILTAPGWAKAIGQAGSDRVEAVYGAGKQADDHLALFRRKWEMLNGE